MNKVNELNQAIYDAEEELEKAQDARHAYLAPIFKAAGLEFRGGITACDRRRNFSKEMIYCITVEYSNSGGTYSNDYSIPASVIEADDPIAAATAWKLTTQTRNAEQQRLQTLAEIERLQQSLK